MPAVSLTPADLAPFATIEEDKAQAMIDDALARAALVAPCIMEDDFTQAAAAKAIIRAAVLRQNDAGSGALQQQQAGPFGATIDTRQTRKGMFYPSELDELRSLCGTSTAQAFEVLSAPVAGLIHAITCSYRFGAPWCSCGADLSLAGPIFGDTDDVAP